MKSKRTAFDEQVNFNRLLGLEFRARIFRLKPSLALTIVTAPWELEIVVEEFHHFFMVSVMARNSIGACVERMLRECVPDEARRVELDGMLWFTKARCGTQWDYVP